MTGKNIYQAYRNKITNKLWGMVNVPAVGKKRGDVLLSYLTGPFTLTPWEHFTDPHTSYWECGEIARLFSIRGYEVDIINWSDTRFIPKKQYAVIVDIKQNLERLSTHLPVSCKKVMHIVFSPRQNEAENTRLEHLKSRRGVTLSPQRKEPSSLNVAYADFLEGFGNKTVHSAFANDKKPIYKIPISVAQIFDFPKEKDFSRARKNFLWFGGGGAILKGLDIVIEAFADMPDTHLHIIGPSAYEKEFERVYARELALSHIHRYQRPGINTNGIMMVGNIPFLEIANMCVALVYPSASEGTSGAVVQGMHAGIIPIITKETGISEDAPAMILETHPSIESIRAQVRAVANMEPETLRAQAYNTWEYARAHHTKETFSGAYSKFISDILHL